MTTMASSTTRPVARVMPKSVSELMLKPKILMKAKVPMSETGMVTAGMMVAANIFDQDDSAATIGTVFQVDIVELSRVCQTANDTDGHLKLLLGVGGLLSELTCGDLDVLLGKRVGDVERGKAAGCEAAGVEPETHGVLALAKDDG